MMIPEIHAQAIQTALAKMVADGMPQDKADHAAECAEKIFALIWEYQSAGLVAMGLAAGTIDALLSSLAPGQLMHVAKDAVQV